MVKEVFVTIDSPAVATDVEKQPVDLRVSAGKKSVKVKLRPDCVSTGASRS